MGKAKQEKVKTAELVVEKPEKIESPAAKAEDSVATEKADIGSKPAKDVDIHSKTTLFVSTIPYEASAEDLESFFSSVGPVKFCFIVKDKTSGKSTGCGYVRFVLPEDAERAITELKKAKFQDKRQLKIKLALKKNVVNERKTGN